ncbi:hypothetical protein AGMMS49579_22420 [Spirochaetia bacterium]|nr:hypothetical protein AGMMS49579_22420 [Spirochaetia bacterium]
MKKYIASIIVILMVSISCSKEKTDIPYQQKMQDPIIYQKDSEENGGNDHTKSEIVETITSEKNIDSEKQRIYKSLDEFINVEEFWKYVHQDLNGYYYNFSYKELGKLQYLFTRYFETEESLSYAVSGTLEEHYITSKDGKLRAFSWYTWNGGTASDDDSLLQYRMSNGKLKAVPLEKIIAQNEKPEYSDSEYEYYGNLTWSIVSIELLKENVYLLHGYAGQGGSFGFIAIELKNDTVYPYYAFNGEMILRLYLPYMKAYDRINPDFLPDLVNFSMDTEAPQYTIELLYATEVKDGWRINGLNGYDVDQSKVVTVTNPLVFNGTKFTGDYELIFALEKRLRAK